MNRRPWYYAPKAAKDLRSLKDGHPVRITFKMSVRIAPPAAKFKVPGIEVDCAPRHELRCRAIGRPSIDQVLCDVFGTCELRCRRSGAYIKNPA